MNLIPESQKLSPTTYVCMSFELNLILQQDFCFEAEKGIEQTRMFVLG